MKNIKILLLSFSLLFSFCATAMELTFTPNLSLGFRGGKESLNDNAVGYVGAKGFLLKHELSGFKQLNILGPGLNFQTDGKFSLSVSPFAISSLSGMTIGVDVFVKEEDVKGGNVGLFLGCSF